MSSLLKSIGEIWEQDNALCALIPFERVFTGRIPQTESVNMPYVSILATQGTQTHRTDKTRYSHGPVSFHIWVDDSDLEFGEQVADAITDAYADHCWSLGGDAKVIDMLDEGEPMAHQVDLPTNKIWEIIKLFICCIQRPRVNRDSECCTELSGDSDTWPSYSSESSSQGSSS